MGKLQSFKQRKESIPTYHHLESNYRVSEKGIEVVIEELKQRITAQAAKIRRYNNTKEQYKQNKMFEESEGKFYQLLDQKEPSKACTLNTEEAKNFWKEIWENTSKHNGQAAWIDKVKEEYNNTTLQTELCLSEAMVEKAIAKMAPWKAPGPDMVQSFWLKRFKSLGKRIAWQLNDCLSNGKSPEWMTSGRTVLIMKDINKGNSPSNYRPITCLPIMWKVFTSILSTAVYHHVNANGLSMWKQKGCGQGTRGAKDHLLLDKAIMKDSKTRRTNLSMAWVDYRKAYDMVPHSWIQQTLEMMKVATNIRTLIANSMQNWKVELENNGQKLGQVKIRRGIFQGDSLSPLLFVLTLTPLTSILRSTAPECTLKGEHKVNHLLYMDDLKVYAKNRMQLSSLLETVKIYSDDIGMQFGLDKCAVIDVKKGSVTMTENLEMMEGEEVRGLGTNDSYKYLGVMESDCVKKQRNDRTSANRVHTESSEDSEKVN